ncbi:TPA: hypothetical protein N0F65_003784 [Lagenidium giganteum]|uniref:RING-type domain-containing protein n=1 Tax=Lagenidium giganteum TaxID=4803 RepID=A0AAV2YDP4_9STRA|nr:TPA: hypothetical protein N0F65_003784 [Lagenidium giganteum]
MILIPLAIYFVLLLVECFQDEPKATAQPQRSVLRVSRALYDRLDPEMLRLLMSNRDFSSADYEQLMRLEEFNEKKSEGATDAQIRRLPLVRVRCASCSCFFLWCSMTTTDNSQLMISESMLKSSKNPSCSICLVNFELGTTVRMIPCFHHFHPECIDPWLKGKAQCPVCKCPAICSD